MKKRKAIIYIHGKGGSAAEAERYKTVLPSFDIFGFEPEEFTPWGSQEGILSFYRELEGEYGEVYLLANSIGAYFSSLALQKTGLKKAFFISPVLDMEALIEAMMGWAGVTEAQLEKEKVIKTSFGEDLSWLYLTYVREHPVQWTIPTSILYARGDRLIAYETVEAFVSTHQARLTVMEEGGEHWFHTQEQLDYLDAWLRRETSPEIC